MNNRPKRYLTYPWLQNYEDAKYRCNNKNHPKYYRYGGRGIKFLLTKYQIEFLWNKDKAYEMKKPSIDRKDNDGNYELSNCRFIELSENSKKNSRTKAVLQYDLDNNFINEYFSIGEASRQLKIPASNISNCLLGNRNTAKGFKWRYKND